MGEAWTRSLVRDARSALAWLVPLLLAQGFALPAAAQAPVAEGIEFQVDTYTTSDQTYPAVASDATGKFVVVWTSNGSSGSDTSGTSIQGQRYAADGTALGSQFQVNSYTPSTQRSPSVASTAGGFVVAWESAGSPGTDTKATSIQAQRYDSSGIPLGGQFQVNSYTTGYQETPSVASDGAGNFVVAWWSDGSFGNDQDETSIQVRRYDSNGVALGSEFQVDTYTTSTQRVPSVSANARGDFVVAWWSNGSAGTDTSGYSIQARRYDSSGAALGSDFQVNTYTSSRQFRPSVAIDGRGGFVVAWENDYPAATSIRARRYDSSGAAQGDEFEVQTYTPPTLVSRSSVAADPSGEFTVTWASFRSSGGDSVDSVQGRRFASDGTPVGDQFQVETYTTGQQFVPRVSVSSGHDLVVVWQSQGSPGTDTSGTSIQAQRYAAFAQGSQFQVNSYTTSAQFDPAVAAGATGEFVVVWHGYGSSGTDTDGASIHGQRYASDGSAAGGEFQVNTYTTGYQEHAAVAADFGGDFVVVWQGYSGIEGQRFDSSGATQGSEFQVNAPTTSGSFQPSVARDPDGDFVVAWTSTGSAGTDHSGYSIQAQRFASNGSPQGSQFQVNTYTTGTQQNPSVALDEVGDFLVVWQSEAEGSLANRWGIRARSFASDGTALDVDEFQVDSYTTNFQDYPSVASDFAGHFVVVWQSNGSYGTDTSYKSIQGQRYASDGTPLGGQFQVNSYTTDFQYRPAVAAAGGGGQFVVTWHSRGSFDSDTDATSIQAQRYASDATPVGGEFQVNSFTPSFQRNPAVAVDASGSHFMVAWESRFSPGTDGSSYSIQGQRYLPEPEASWGLAAGSALLLALRRSGARTRKRCLGAPPPR